MAAIAAELPEDIRAVREVVKAIVDYLPDNVDHRGALANAAALDGDPAAAWGHHEVNLRIFAMSRTVVTGAQGLAIGERRKALAAGELETAEEWAERARSALDAYLAKRPGDAWGFVLRGYTRLECGDIAAAEEDAAAAREIKPDEPGLSELDGAIRSAKGGR